MPAATWGANPAILRHMRAELQNGAAMTAMTFEIRRPTAAMLPAYVDALQRGWSPDNVRGEVAAREQLAKIAEDAASFLDLMDDPEARGGPITMLDGSKLPRLPGFVRWMWDGEFCGSIGFRWVPGSVELPPHVMGHIGYAVVPWKRGLGYASRALGLMLEEPRKLGMASVQITTEPHNVASQKVILANGGVLVGEFTQPESYGGHPGLRYRVDL